MELEVKASTVRFLLGFELLEFARVWCFHSREAADWFLYVSFRSSAFAVIALLLALSRQHYLCFGWLWIYRSMAYTLLLVRKHREQGGCKFFSWFTCVKIDYLGVTAKALRRPPKIYGDLFEDRNIPVPVLFYDEDPKLPII